MSIKRAIFLIFFILSITHTEAQKTKIYSFSDMDFNRGLELYNMQKYGAAQDLFNLAIVDYGNEKSTHKAEAQFYTAMCAVELFQLESEFLVSQFVNQNPESPLVNEAYFRLAGYFYKNKNYPKTISYYNKVDRYLLTGDEISEYYFNKGYSYYSANNFAEARTAFFEIKDIDSKYSSPALYYYSHIAYSQENYETALNGFLRLTNDATFSEIAPYYVAQIYFMQKKYEKVIDFAPPLMDSINDKRAGEMAKIIGESYFNLGKYKESIPFLERYRDEVKQISIPDRYQLAFAYYMNKNYQEAAKLFESISYNNSEISQSALYLLADCYLHIGDKRKARSAFASASGMDFNQVIQEDALFNYAKVTYELSYSPFNEAIRSFNRYISLYPASARVDEAYHYLVLAYMNTRNYQMAMESLDKIREKDHDMEKAYQRVAFFRGLELFTNLRFLDAISTFDRSLQFAGFDETIKVRTYYWIAEAYFRINDISHAETYYKLFMEEPLFIKVPEYIMLNYSMGYVEFSRKNYKEAESWFFKYTNLEKNKNAVTLADAFNRLGDIKFIDSRYKEAIVFYTRVIQMAKADVDYAMFQVGFSQGLIDQPAQKIESLKKLIHDFPTSIYIDDALFELGKTYSQINLLNDALTSYNDIINNYPNSNYLSKTLIQLGLINYTLGNTDQSLSYYKKVVSDYPGTPEAANALKSVRDIYVDKNAVDEYLAYVEKTGTTLSMNEQDSLVYTSAENIYVTGDCAKAIVSLNNYIARFREGNYLLNAHYYRADCLLKNQKTDDALESLKYIISQPSNMFTEPALVAATRITFTKEDYNSAAELYLKLIETGEKKINISEAEIGLMRCYVKLNEYQKSINLAQQVLLQDKLQTEIKREAMFTIANAYLKQNDVNAALGWFKKVAVEVNSKEGAESKYRVAELLFNQGDRDAAEKEIYNYIDMNTPHVYWMGKSFLLLSDILVAKQDEFQAVQTLQSIIDYYNIENDGIKEEAIKRKKIITDKMKIKEVIPSEDQLEIKIQ